MGRPLPEIDIQFQIRTTHRPGFLGSLFVEIGKLGGLIGDIRTEYIGKAHAIRNITISVFDEGHRAAITHAINNHKGAAVLASRDVVFERHQGGKIRSQRRHQIESVSDLRCFYTPGVARVCTAIQLDPEKARTLTNIGNSVAIITNGTRVLGLGDIGPTASMPVMEGKAMIYDQFVGISATPILLDTKDPQKFIETVVTLAPTFAGIHLEDIRVPDCFLIETELQRRLKKPVMHDDQHGTATVALAAVLAALKGSQPKARHELTITQVGLGAAGFGIARLLHVWGARVIGVDPDPLARARLESLGARTAPLAEAIAASNVVVSTTGVVGLIKPEMIRAGQVILALSNPVPEITVDDALEAGAAFAADGKSVNNALAYPGLFRAALDLQCSAITDAMKIAAAETIASFTPEDELLPSIFQPGLHEKVTAAASRAALSSTEA